MNHFRLFTYLIKVSTVTSLGYAIDCYHCEISVTERDFVYFHLYLTEHSC